MNTEEVEYFKLSLDEREKFFFNKFPEAKKLKKILLAIGGEKVIWMPYDPHLSLLISEGQRFSLDKRKKTKGEVNQCHTNVAKLFLKKNINIATGFTLGGDRWLQHSWGYDGKRIIETTQLFDAYYGVILSGLNITKFVFGQLKDEIMKFPKEQVMKLPLPENINDFIRS